MERLSLIILILLLPLGILEINKNFRDKNWKLHVNLGKIYIALSLLLALHQVFYSLFADLRIFEASGLRISAFIWLGFLVQAIRFTYKKRFFAHGIWMRRCLLMNIITPISILLLLCVEEGTNLAIAVVWLPLILGVAAYELRALLTLFQKNPK